MISPDRQEEQGSWYTNHGKRILDVAFAAPALVIAAPLVGLVMIAVWITMGTPVIFRQTRPGLHERPFTLYKIKTMTNPEDPLDSSAPDSQRLTALGKAIRRSSIDELPELFNVIKGDMSLVGPRPLLMRYLPYIQGSERARFDVRPGLTGLAQIRGRNAVAWAERFALDVEYRQTVSLRTDLMILLRTVPMLLSARGIVVDPASVLKNLDVERSADL